MTGARHPAFAEAARVPAVEVLRRRGLGRVAGAVLVRGKGSPCPGCGNEKGAFSAFKGGYRLKCHSCGESWDAVSLVQLLDRIDALGAARSILGYPADGSGDPPGWPRAAGAVSPGPVAPSRPSADKPAPPARAALARLPQCAGFVFTPFGWQDGADIEARRDARRVAAEAAAYDAWRRAVMSFALFTSVPGRPRLKAWLQARGLDPQLLPDAVAALTESAAMIYGPAPRGDLPDGFQRAAMQLNGRPRVCLTAPAMVARIEVPGAPAAGGLHATYLSADGRKKAAAPGGPARKMWAAPGGARGGVWLTARGPAEGPLFVGEGIETVLSVLMEYRLRQGEKRGRALALLSLGNLQGGVARDGYGRWQLDPPESDPRAPAVTWPRMGEVIVCADHDMAPLTVKARGGPRVLGAAARMDLSIRLAVAAWRAAGAARVSALRPPPGADWNDIRRQKAAGTEGGLNA